MNGPRHELLLAFRQVLRSTEHDPHAIEIIERYHADVQQRRISVTELSFQMHVRTSSLHRYFRDTNYPISVPRGRRPAVSLEELRRRIQYFRSTTGLSPGYKRIAQSIRPEAPPYSGVYRVLHPTSSHPEPEKPQHLRRYSAKYTDYIWHTDLHEIYAAPDGHGGRLILYTIAFIDDATRYITGWNIIANKSAATTAETLRQILASRPKPCIVGSDNGGEFRGEPFVQVLKENGIRPWYGKAYTPEHNGKIERFWRTMGNATDHTMARQIISNFVHEYNEVWTHSSLGMTPAAARAQIPRWDEVPGEELIEDIWGNLDWEE